VTVDDVLTLDIEKPAAGGQMLARHLGQVVLVGGAIPGERVRARVSRVAKGVAHADAIEVVTSSPDRREVSGDWRCGGNVLAHVAYPRQQQLKAEIVVDAFRRIGRLPLETPPAVVPSPEHGYRLRARLHVQGDRVGFYREGTHEICDAAATGQLSEWTSAWIVAAQDHLRATRLAGLLGIEIAENIAADRRVCHLELQAGTEAAAFGALADGLAGLSAQTHDRAEVTVLAGVPTVSDVLHVRSGDPATALRLHRDVRAFFQGNRFLIEPLVRHVAELVPGGPVVDLYAGVGLFGLSLLASGREAVTVVEGDPISGADLQGNAAAFGGRARVERRSVEAFLRAGTVPAGATFVIDPPRTGLSKDALAGILRHRPATIVYVSCDVATLARDARGLIDAGYEPGSITSFDLFPNTAHVETVAAFARART
jgi:23S rRNA (uracil1939-C5)-methyltransferase